jgi:4-hydroxy-tetrahydrodipicolinate synthase
MNSQVDEKAFERFVDWQITQGTKALVVCGTTGESPTLTESEQDRLIRIAVTVAAGRVPILAGTGSNSTAHTIHRTQAAMSQGANAALIVSPYYNKPTQEGLYQHFKAVHDATQIPIVLYNIPGRCVVDILPPLMQRLSQLPRVIGVKDSTNDLTRPFRTTTDCGKDFIQLSGEDGTAASHLAQGGVGCVSVTSNIAPRLCADMQAAWVANDKAAFAAARDRLAPLHQVMFLETSPAPVKYALSLLGYMSEEVRLPLVTCTAATKTQIEAAMNEAGLLNAKAA